MKESELEKSIREKVSHILYEKGTTVAEFARTNKLVQTTLCLQLNGNSKISLQTILSILDSYKDVSAEWLLRGVGSMYLDGKVAQQVVTTINNAHTHTGNANAGCQNYDQSALLAEKDKRIEELQKDKENLMTLLNNMTKK